MSQTPHPPRVRCWRAPILWALILVGAGHVQAVFGQSPTPSRADPMERMLSTYVSRIEEDLKPAFEAYEKVTQPAPGWPALQRPSRPLSRIVGVEALSVLPLAWVKPLEAAATEAQAQGEKDGPFATTPGIHVDFETRYTTREPGGSPLVTLPEPAASGNWPAQSTPPAAALDALALLQKSGGPAPADPLAYKARALAAEAAFQKFVRERMVVHLLALRTESLPIIHKAAGLAAATPAMPWRAVGSPRLDMLVKEYLAERYFKGRWVVGRQGVHGTGSAGSGAPSELGYAKDRLKAQSDEKPWGTGSSETPQKLTTGTGTGPSTPVSRVPSALGGTGGPGGNRLPR